MTISYRTANATELEAVAAAAELPFGDTVQPADAELFAELAEPDRLFVAEEGGRIVGVGGGLSHDLSVPGGGTVPMCTVGMLSVLPTHRRRGVASALLDALHTQAAARAEPVAGLMASEARIYGRFGYGIATHWASREIATAHAALRAPVDVTGRTRFVEPEEACALMGTCLSALRRTTPGIPGGTEAYIRGRLTRDPEHWRDGAGARMLVAYEDRGLVAYRVKPDWTLAGPDHTFVIHDLVARDDEALAGLWAYCLGADLVGTVRAWGRPLDEPLPHLLVDPRRLRDRVTDALWLRVLDTAALLRARRYDADGGWTIQVVDGGPAAGVVRLEVRDGEPSVEEGTGVPDVFLPVGSLAAAYLGGTRLTALARAGRATEQSAGALRALDRALAWDPLPWCPFEI